MDITRIKAPTFKIGRNVLNEYELRVLIKDIVLGKTEGNIRVKEVSSGNISVIDSDGFINPPMLSLALMSTIVLSTIKARRDGKE